MNRFWIPLLFIGMAAAVAVARKRRSAARPADGGASESPTERNPGPQNGLTWMRWSLCLMPGWFNEGGLSIGAGIAVATLPRQRQHSRDYLRLALGREPRIADVWRHFNAFSHYLRVRLDIASGLVPPVRFAAGHGDELRSWLATNRPALYGTMHLGNSDLVGFFLGDIGGRIHMIRKRVGNSEDTEGLARRYSRHVSYIWINDWKRLVLAMNDALRAGCSLAMQCDRPEHSSKLEAFRFLGARRLFPFTIYHLAIMHERPVIFSYGLPDEDEPGGTVVYVHPIFHPRAEAKREENFAAARLHFQSFLDDVEARLREKPFLWFNFTSMNPLASIPESGGRGGISRNAADRGLAPAPAGGAGDRPGDASLLGAEDSRARL